MHTLYILKSDRENWFYVGITSSISKRIKLHNAGKVRSTKSRRPFKVIYTEDYGTKTEARRRELEIKKSWKLKKELIKNSLSAPSSNG